MTCKCRCALSHQHWAALVAFAHEELAVERACRSRDRFICICQRTHGWIGELHFFCLNGRKSSSCCTAFISVTIIIADGKFIAIVKIGFGERSSAQRAAQWRRQRRGIAFDIFITCTFHEKKHVIHRFLQHDCAHQAQASSDIAALHALAECLLDMKKSRFDNFGIFVTCSAHRASRDVCHLNCATLDLWRV